jgi:hypothetical protein
MNFRTTTNLNLREGPGTEYRVIRTLPTGAEVVLADSGWLPMQGGGYVSRSYLVPTVALAPAPSPRGNLRQAALAIAGRYDGGKETGNNAGPLVELYLRNVGLGVGNPWCAAFVLWCSDMAAAALGIDNPLRVVPSKALVRSHVATAKARGWVVARPEAGDLFAYVNPDGSGHIGFVERVADGVIHTVEGNTNAQNSREGDGVYRRQRKITPSLVFIRY